MPPLPLTLGGATLTNCQYGSASQPPTVGIGIRLPEVSSPVVKLNLFEPLQVVQSCASSPRARVKRRTAKVIFFIVVFLIELFSGMLRDEGLYPGGLVGKGRGWSG